MIWNRLSAALVSSLLLLSASNNAAAQQCSNALSTLVASALKPALAGIDACAGLKRRVSTPLGTVTLGIDKTGKVELRSLQYCPSNPDSRLEAAVYVKCKTSDAAIATIELDETFDITMTVRNEDCKITAFSVTPRGEIGQLVAKLAGLSDRLRPAAAQHIRTLCK